MKKVLNHSKQRNITKIAYKWHNFQIFFFHSDHQNVMKKICTKFHGKTLKSSQEIVEHTPKSVQYTLKWLLAE